MRILRNNGTLGKTDGIETHDSLMGYHHPFYAFSFQEFGEPRELPRCGGWVLVRKIPGTPHQDAMGCYPLFTCQDWSQLPEDLKDIEAELVSLVLVTDPFGAFDETHLAQCFQRVRPFKKHLIADLSKGHEGFVSEHHRYYARRSLRDLKVDICEEPLQYIDDWMTLYGHLIKRHNIDGMRAFSKRCFEMQMKIPGATLIVGKLGQEVVGAHLILINGNVSYSHLAAFSESGYKHSASYGIYWMTLNHLKDRNIQFLDLGASAGVGENAQDGLSKFKAGWSNDSRTVYLCGRVFSHQTYESIRQQFHIPEVDYFPAYRRDEF